MSDDERRRRVDAARVGAGLTVQELRLRYVALGGPPTVTAIDWAG